MIVRYSGENGQNNFALDVGICARFPPKVNVEGRLFL
jgi:hypothetical protein